MLDTILTTQTIYCYPLKSSYELNEISYNSNDMVWRSLPGTVIPDYEESTNLVLLRSQEFFISVLN